MDIVHCYDVIMNYATWYPGFQKKCLYRESRLPAVKALRLPYIERAKDISLNDLVLMIHMGLPKDQILEIFHHYYGMDLLRIFRNMKKVDLVQKLAEQLVSDLVERDGTDDNQEEEVPAAFTRPQIQQVLQLAKPDPELIERLRIMRNEERASRYKRAKKKCCPKCSKVLSSKQMLQNHLKKKVCEN